MKIQFFINALILGVVVESTLILPPAYNGRICPGAQTFRCEEVMGNELTWHFEKGNTRSQNIRLTMETMAGPETTVGIDPPIPVVLGGPSVNQEPPTITSTLSITLNNSHNGIALVCSDFAGIVVGSVSFNVTVPSAPPSSISVFEQTTSATFANVTLRWNPPTNNGGANVTSYTVTVSQLPQSRSVVTSPVFTVTDVDYNVDYTVSVVATNCAGDSPAEIFNIRINGCPTLTNPMNGAYRPIADRLSGTVVTLQCDPGYESSVSMVTCEGTDTLMWSPDPDTIECTSRTSTTPAPMDCTEQLNAPQNGSVENHTVPVAPDTQVTFQCDNGLFPDMIMTATCLSTGQWDTNPVSIVCRTSPVSCVLPDPPPNGLVLLDPKNANTTEGSVISLQCEPGYMGGGNSTCSNSGSWDPELAMLCVVEAAGSGIAPIVGGAVGGLFLFVILLIVIIIIVLLLVSKHRDKYRTSEQGIELTEQSEGHYSETTHTGPRSGARQNRAPPPEVDGYNRIDRPLDAAPEAYDDVTLNSEPRVAVNSAGYSALNGDQGPPRLPGYGQLNNVATVEPVIYADLTPRGAKPANTAQVDQHRVDYADVDHIATQRRAATMPASPVKPPPPALDKAAAADKLLNLDQALVQLRTVQPRWQELAGALRVPETYIQQVEDMYRSDHASAMTEVVDYWMRSCSGKPTWRELADALRMIKEDHLAQQLMGIYETGRLPVELDMNEVPPDMYKYDNAPPPPVPTRSPTMNETDSPGLSRTLPARHPRHNNAPPAPLRPPKPASKDEFALPPRPPKPPPKH